MKEFYCLLTYDCQIGPPGHREVHILPEHVEHVEHVGSLVMNSL